MTREQRTTMLDALDLVDPLEISVRLGVQHRTVHEWRKRRRQGARFPRPAAVFSVHPVWFWADVHAWAVATGRLPIQRSA